MKHMKKGPAWETLDGDEFVKNFLDNGRLRVYPSRFVRACPAKTGGNGTALSLV